MTHDQATQRAYHPHEVYYPGGGRGAVPFPEPARWWWQRLRRFLFCVRRLCENPDHDPHTVRKHYWMPAGFADWRCKHCGCWR